MFSEPCCNNLATLPSRFGGLGFELMRDGDVNGLWGLMEHGIRRVIMNILVNSVSH